MKNWVFWYNYIEMPFSTKIKPFIFIICFSVFLPIFVFAQNKIDDLKSKIDDRNSKIKQIEEEIKAFNNEINKTTKETKTLQNTIKSLDTTDKKLKADINLTASKIDKTNFVIQDLSFDIEETEKRINSDLKALEESLRNLYQKEDENIVVVFLNNKNLNDFFDHIEYLKRFNKELKVKNDELQVLKNDLTSKKQSQENENKRLKNLKEDLSDKKKIVEINKIEKSTLLVQTKNKEATYKELLKQKQTEKDLFEKELFEFESQLRYEIDPSKLPSAKSGILSWPLDDVYITQQFGRTNASKRLYVSGSHNGVDFRASVGTPVKSVLSGTVIGTGNTDEVRGCSSFGKWVMVRHNNGLSTIYGHLSLIKVAEGQTVSTGDVIGFSGNTGYSTGPHLHLGVYASQGVRIEKFANSKGCKNVRMPLADIKAYLDPMLYLPSL